MFITLLQRYTSPRRTHEFTVTRTNALLRKAASLLAALVALASWHAAAAVTAGIVTSNATQVAGVAAFSWTITLTNAASIATDVRMTLPMPNGALFSNHSLAGTAAGSYACIAPEVGTAGTFTCEAASVPASGVATITVVAIYRVDMSGGVRTTTVRVVSGGTESVASVQHTVQNTAALFLSLSATPAVAAGGLVSLRARIQSNGGSSGINGTLTIPLPAGLAFVGVYGSRDLDGTCSYDPVAHAVQCLATYLTSGAALHDATVVTRSSYDLAPGPLTTTATLVAGVGTVSGSPASASTTVSN